MSNLYILRQSLTHIPRLKTIIQGYMFLAVMEPNHVERPAIAIVQTGLRDRGGYYQD